MEDPVYFDLLSINVKKFIREIEKHDLSQIGIYRNSATQAIDKIMENFKKYSCFQLNKDILLDDLCNLFKRYIKEFKFIKNKNLDLLGNLIFY